MSEGCKRFQRVLEELLDQRLDAVEAAALAEHLTKCPQCQGIQSARLHLRDMVRGCMNVAEALPPPSLRARIMVSIHRETQLRIRSVDCSHSDGDEPDF